MGAKPDKTWEDYWMVLKEEGYDLVAEQARCLITPLCFGDPMTYISGGKEVDKEIEELVHRELSMHYQREKQ